MKEHIFEVNDEEYEVKLGRSGMLNDQIIVQVFNTKTGDEVGFRYSVSYDINVDMERFSGVSGIQSLIEVAKDDVRNKRWEELNEIMKNVPRQLCKTSEIKWM